MHHQHRHHEAQGMPGAPRRAPRPGRGSSESRNLRRCSSRAYGCCFAGDMKNVAQALVRHPCPQARPPPGRRQPRRRPQPLDVHARRRVCAARLRTRACSAPTTIPQAQGSRRLTVLSAWQACLLLVRHKRAPKDVIDAQCRQRSLPPWHVSHCLPGQTATSRHFPCSRNVRHRMRAEPKLEAPEKAYRQGTEMPGCTSRVSLEAAPHLTQRMVRCGGGRSPRVATRPMATYLRETRCRPSAVSAWSQSLRTDHPGVAPWCTRRMVHCKPLFDRWGSRWYSEGALDRVLCRSNANHTRRCGNFTIMQCHAHASGCAVHPAGAPGQGLRGARCAARGRGRSSSSRQASSYARGRPHQRQARP